MPVSSKQKQPITDVSTLLPSDLASRVGMVLFGVSGDSGTLAEGIALEFRRGAALASMLQHVACTQVLQELITSQHGQ